MCRECKHVLSSLESTWHRSVRLVRHLFCSDFVVVFDVSTMETSSSFFAGIGHAASFLMRPSTSTLDGASLYLVATHDEDDKRKLDRHSTAMTCPLQARGSSGESTTKTAKLLDFTRKRWNMKIMPRLPKRTGNCIAWMVGSPRSATSAAPKAQRQRA